VIIKGDYSNGNNYDQILIGEDKMSIRLSHASSGQQEAIWAILSIVDKLFLIPNPILIIEEPETHLYPESQKIITS
jgi:predicted ATP-dependent endonuclease of OLD family